MFLIFISDDEYYFDDNSYKRGWLNSIPQLWIHVNNPSLENKWLCITCNKYYKYRRCLARHLKLECGKTPTFQCPHCSLRCFQRSNLIKHIRVKHSYQLNELEVN